jgi:hypothetical protein
MNGRKQPERIGLERKGTEWYAMIYVMRVEGSNKYWSLSSLREGEINVY